jgi:hypothetical protein
MTVLIYFNTSNALANYRWLSLGFWQPEDRKCPS